MKNVMSAVLLLVGISAVAILSQERISLTVPETVPANSSYRVGPFTMDPDDPGTPEDDGVLTFQLIGVERRTSLTCTYSAKTTPTGTFLINALNKANFSLPYAGNATTGSLVQRIFHRLVTMGEASMACGRPLNGTLVGGPQ